MIRRFKAKGVRFAPPRANGGTCHDNPDMEELSMYVPQVFDKIASNLERYLKHLEKNEAIDE